MNICMNAILLCDKYDKYVFTKMTHYYTINQSKEKLQNNF